MLVRFAWLALAVSTVSLAEQPTTPGKSTLSVGDRMVLNLTDNAAIKYFGFASYPYPENAEGTPNWISMPLESSVVAIGVGRIIVEHYVMSDRNSDSPSMISITASNTVVNLSGPNALFDPFITREAIPDAVSRTMKCHAGLPTVRVHDCSAVTIRRWTLTSSRVGGYLWSCL